MLTRCRRILWNFPLKSRLLLCQQLPMCQPTHHPPFRLPGSPTIPLLYQGSHLHLLLQLQPTDLNLHLHLLPLLPHTDPHHHLLLLLLLLLLIDHSLRLHHHLLLLLPLTGHPHLLLHLLLLLLLTGHLHRHPNLIQLQLLTDHCLLLLLPLLLPTDLLHLPLKKVMPILCPAIHWTTPKRSPTRVPAQLGLHPHHLLLSNLSILHPHQSLLLTLAMPNCQPDLPAQAMSTPCRPIRSSIPTNMEPRWPRWCPQASVRPPSPTDPSQLGQLPSVRN